MDIKEEIKEEPCLPDFSSQNERELYSKDFVNSVKSEGLTSGSDCDIDIKTEIKEEAVDSNFCSENQREFISEHPVIMQYNVTKDSLFEPKIELTEGQCWVKAISTETLCIYDDIKHEADDIHSTKSTSLYKEGDSSYKTDLFSNEDFRNDISLNKRICSPECEDVRNYQSQESDVIDESPIETSICSETPDAGKVASMVSCLKHTHFLQSNNTNKQVINMENSKPLLRGEDTKAYECDICQKSFKYSFNLKTHRLVHESKKANKCDVCERDFKHLSSLKRHKLVHEGEKPHKCDICNKAFTQSSNMKTHKLIHEGLKPHSGKIYKCDICDKTFSRFYRLKIHKLIHEGIALHKCNFCDKTFMELYDLKRHKLSHEGIKPHKCKVCNKTFTLVHHLNTHKLIHEDKKPQ